MNINDENINNDNEIKSKIKSSDIAEADDFDKALASRDATIEKLKYTIKDLKSRVGKREQLISDLNEKLDAEKSLRIEAQSKIAEGKNLKKQGMNYTPKTEQEQFEENYLKAKKRLGLMG